MHGIIPAVVLARLEELTGTPAIDLFQVLSGVSTGSIIVGGLSVRAEDNKNKAKFTALDSVELFCNYGPKFFPHIPGRVSKYMTAGILNYFRDQTDPVQIERFLIRDIREQVRLICEGNKNNSNIVRAAIDIRKLATIKYISKSRKKKASKACDKLLERDDIPHEARKHIKELNRMILARRAKGMLSAAFNATLFKGMDAVKSVWAKDFLFDPKIIEGTLREYLGDATLKDTMKSTYIATLDLERREMVTFFSRKDDFFSTDPDTPTTTSENNEALWDAIMASVANPFAYPPHRTESGMLCGDKAIVHTPLPCVEDVLRHKDDDTDVKLIYLGTGHFSYRHENDKYINYGVSGNLMDGREISDLERYTSTTARELIAQKLGKDGIIEINPSLQPEKWDDEDRLPHRDILNASPENVKKLLQFATEYVHEEETDRVIKDLALDLSENLYKIGQMSEEKYNQIKQRCQDPNAQTPSNDNNDGINRTITNMINNIIPKKWPRLRR